MKWLLRHGTIIIVAGGGGIPTVFDAKQKLHGVDSVIDKDLCSELLARQAQCRFFIMTTDADGVYAGSMAQTPQAIPLIVS
jgi:carbamate kinase